MDKFPQLTSKGKGISSSTNGTFIKEQEQEHAAIHFSTANAYNVDTFLFHNGRPNALGVCESSFPPFPAILLFCINHSYTNHRNPY